MANPDFMAALSMRIGNNGPPIKSEAEKERARSTSIKLEHVTRARPRRSIAARKKSVSVSLDNFAMPNSADLNVSRRPLAVQNDSTAERAQLDNDVKKIIGKESAVKEFMLKNALFMVEKHEKELKYWKQMVTDLQNISDEKKNDVTPLVAITDYDFEDDISMKTEVNTNLTAVKEEPEHEVTEEQKEVVTPAPVESEPGKKQQEEAVPDNVPKETDPVVVEKATSVPKQRGRTPSPPPGNPAPPPAHPHPSVTATTTPTEPVPVAVKKPKRASYMPPGGNPMMVGLGDIKMGLRKSGKIPQPVPVKEDEPTIPPCNTCQCSDFKKNAFKKNQCNNCFHNHSA